MRASQLSVKKTKLKENNLSLTFPFHRDFFWECMSWHREASAKDAHIPHTSDLTPVLEKTGMAFFNQFLPEEIAISVQRRLYIAEIERVIRDMVDRGANMQVALYALDFGEKKLYITQGILFIYNKLT